MNRSKATLGAAAAGVVAGVVGLAVLAAPAGAGPAPSLPATTPEALVQSVLTARPTALAGTVEVDNQLGLPAVPGIPDLANGKHDIRIWADGTGRGRVSVPTPTGEQTFVDDGSTLYAWNSADRTVVETKVNRDAGLSTDSARGSAPMDPASAARELVSALRASSTISVDGTDTVAGRAAYDLVLTPKPTERTLLREVTIAVDAQAHVPLRLTVLASNTATPALSIGFANVSFRPQDGALFHFTPPAGATVTHGDHGSKRSTGMMADLAPRVVGTSWDAVLVAHLPSGSGTGTHPGGGSPGGDPLSLVRQLGTPVSGPWGSGWVIATNIGTALVTADGRVAVGMVPQQVLIDALGQAK